MLFCPAPNSESFSQLRVLAAPVQQSLERYFMTVTLIHSQGSGRISTRQLEDLSHLLGQRLSILYEFNSPEFFDKGLFKRFIETLVQQHYLTISAEGLIAFDHRLSTMAEDANLVLDAETINTLKHIASITDEEVAAAMLALERKAKKRKPRA
jgi:glycerol-3-phosphate O-acyltransferase